MDPRNLIAFIKTRRIFSPEDHILLAVSGGIDSTVMAHLFHLAKFNFAIAHCNFGLRGEESDQDAEFVKRLALQFRVDFFSTRFTTTSCASQKGISIQMAARELRYEWFENIRQKNGFNFIATAHHLDDQVETFLINLIRGTGIAGLHGIPIKNDRVIRPLMFAYRNDIEHYAGIHQLQYRTDHSNSETKYLRNKIRHELIPLLCSFNPEFTHGLTETISRIGDFEQIGNQELATWRKNALSSNGREHTVDIGFLRQQVPPEPYAWALLSPFGFNETQVSNIVECLGSTSARKFSTSTHLLVKERSRILIRPIENLLPDKTYEIRAFAKTKKISKPVLLHFHRITDCKKYEIPVQENHASLDFDKLKFPLTIKKWQPGDAFFPIGMRKKKKLSDFFIDQKFSLHEKEQTWLLCSGNNIIWIIGRRIDNRYRVTSETKEILKIVTKKT